MKKIFHDIIPNERRTIRNIPLNKKEGAIYEDVSEASDSQETSQRKAEHPKRDIQADSKTEAKIHHSVDGIRQKSNIKVEPAFYVGKSEDLNNETEAKTNTKNKAVDAVDSDNNNDGEFDESFDEWRGSKKNSYWRAWTALFALLVVGIFIFSIYFSRATISINTMKHDFVLKESLIELSTISHEAVSIDKSASEQVSANGTLKVDRKATGKIVLYNAFNSSPQKLVEGTRLETPNGLVYKLKTAVTIPAQKTVSGKPVPGSVEAEVEASEPGEKYNQGFKDFNIVAYKNSDRYEAIYGRSKTALANGFSGTVPNILPKDVTKAVEIIKEKISKEVDEYFAEKAQDKGKQYVYLPSTKQVVFNEVKQEVLKDNKTAVVKLEAKASAVLFDSASLFEQIIKNQTEMDSNSTSTTDSASTSDTTGITNDKEIIYTGDLSKLNVSTKNANEILVNGTTTISSAIESERIKKAVSGLSKEQAIGAIKRLVELETIEIDIWPWWNKSLPSADRIEIKLED